MNRVIIKAINFIKTMREQGYSDDYIDACYLAKQCRLNAYEFSQLLNKGK
jgi:hypothetical protein